MVPVARSKILFGRLADICHVPNGLHSASEHCLSIPFTVMDAPSLAAQSLYVIGQMALVAWNTSLTLSKHNFQSENQYLE